MFFSRRVLQEFLFEVVSKKFPNADISTVPEVEIAPGKYGDFSTPVAFRLSPILKKPPYEIAKTLVKHIEEKQSNLAEIGLSNLVKIEGGGYINFFIDTKNVHEFFPSIANAKEKVAKKIPRTSYFIEFVSANPTGPLHIGHGRWAVVGSVLSNILQWCGHKVHCEFYVNDCGIQIEKLRESVRRIRENIPLEEDHYGGEYMKIFKKNKEDPKEFFLESQKAILKKIGVTFDHFYLESTLHEEKKIDSSIEILRKSGMTYEKDGALWFASSKKGDEKDRVLRKQDGSYTYFAVDVAYHTNKLERGTTSIDGYKKYINILGSDHHGYVSRLEAAFNTVRESLGGEKFESKQLQILLGQLVSLFRSNQPVRMSKREGEMITLEEVVEEIGVEATRYFLLQRSLDTPITFDLDVVKKKSAENPLYYVQYAHARICSIQQKAKEKGIESKSFEQFEYVTIVESDLHAILRMLLLFDEVVETAADRLEVHLIPTYLYDVSSIFHRWYEKVRFIGEGEEEKAGHYLCFLEVIQRVLSKGLELMGIRPMNSM